MNNIICLLLGLLTGAIICYIAYHRVLEIKNKTIEDLKIGLKKHNYREIQLLFINRSIKDYVKQQQNILKSNNYIPVKIKTITDEESVLVGRYLAFKDIEKAITQLEKNLETLTKE